MEGVSVCWIDEAQAISKGTLDVLIPTIRRDDAKIFFSMNRHVANDPVYSFLKNRDDCLRIHIDYFDNQFCTDALHKEAAECKKVSMKDYDHIWLGHPLDMAEDAVFSQKELDYSATNKYPMRGGYGIKVAGYDIARYGDDKCAAVIICQMGALHWEVSLVDEWDHKDLNYTTGRIMMTTNEQNVSESVIDEDGLGAGPYDTLTKGRQLDDYYGFRNPQIAYKDDKQYANVRTRNAYKLKDMLMKGHICIPDDRLREELATMKYTFDHNQRRILVSKDQMRKQGIKSPNMADALIMAVSRIGHVKAKQDREYTPPDNDTYGKEENLFNIAGVR